MNGFTNTPGNTAAAPVRGGVDASLAPELEHAAAVGDHRKSRLAIIEPRDR